MNTFTSIKLPAMKASISDFDGKQIEIQATQFESPFVRINVGAETVYPNAKSLIHAILSVHPDLFEEKKK